MAFDSASSLDENGWMGCHDRLDMTQWTIWNDLGNAAFCQTWPKEHLTRPFHARQDRCTLVKISTTEVALLECFLLTTVCLQFKPHGTFGDHFFYDLCDSKTKFQSNLNCDVNNVNNFVKWIYALHNMTLYQTHQIPMTGFLNSRNWKHDMSGDEITMEKVIT